MFVIFMTMVSSCKLIWNQCSHFHITIFWYSVWFDLYFWLSFFSSSALYYVFVLVWALTCLLFVVSNFMNAWQLNISVHNDINKNISLFSRLFDYVFACVCVCVVFWRQQSSNSLSLNNVIWFGWMLLPFNVEITKYTSTRKMKKQKNTCIEM